MNNIQSYLRSIPLFIILLLQAAAVKSQTNDGVFPVGVIGEPSGTGSYPAIAESYSSMPINTVYRPLVLPQERLPLLLWGNGACSDDGLSYAVFLREISSHGFIIVAAGYPRETRATNNAAPAETAASAAPQRAIDPTQPQQLLDAIDWIQAQNNEPDSPFYQHVDLDNLGVMGHSCGGLQALAMSADPRVDTTILFNSGVLNAGPDAGRSGISVLKSDLEKIHAPIAYINGGPSDIAYLNAVDDFERINHVPAFFGENQVGHGGTFRIAPNGGDYAQFATAWMSWQLKGNHQTTMFLGEDCDLCSRPNWKVQKKQID
jgi:hypothetical protein